MKSLSATKNEVSKGSMYSITLQNKNKRASSLTSERRRSKNYKKSCELEIETPNRNRLAEDCQQQKSQNLNNYEIFRQTMEVLLFWGQCWGLNPVIGITAKIPSDVRFQFNSFRCWYSALIGSAQFGISCLGLYSMFSNTMNISAITLFCFFCSTFLITVLSLRMASKWPTLVQELSTSNLDVNPHIKTECILAFAMFVGIAFVEHILSIISDVTFVLDCLETDGDTYGSYIQNTFSVLFAIGLPYHLVVGMCLQLLVVACVVNWNYSDLLIVCISIYLTSVLEEMNKKVCKASINSLPPSSWRELREAFTRATRLVRMFDEVVNNVIFVSFATSLFFVCLQLYNVLSHGLRGNMDETCLNFPSGPFRGYEHSIYYLVSLLTVLLRALSVALTAARVHSASKAALPALYEVPTQDYNEEVQRFIEQIHGDTVALTGSNFFNMTRDLVLTVAGAIVTYELVLLQFKGETGNMVDTGLRSSFLKKLNSTGKKKLNNFF